MVTPAGKELLKNTINTVKLHNRLLEENEMWRHWNLEKGLTMMVSDDMFRAEKYIEKLKKTSKKQKKKRHKEQHKKDKHRNRESHHSSKDDCVKVPDSSADRWDHSGFEELYPESKPPPPKNESSEPKRSSKEVRKHKRSASNASPSTYSDSSDSKEVWEEFRLSKRKKRRHRETSKERIPKFWKCDNDDCSHKISKKHKREERTVRKGSDRRQCESRNSHHKHEKKAKDVPFKYS